VEERRIEALATVPLKPKFIPLTLAVGPFDSDTSQGNAFLVVGGTRNDIQVYSLENLPSEPQIKLCATLTGHEAWIRSLALTRTGRSDGGYLLASASQDKYVRIWRFHSSGQQSPVLIPTETNAPSTLAAKVQTVTAGSHAYRITFEALLLGHDDWIYSASWSPSTSASSSDPRLLTASADGSLSIWEPDPISGIWLSVSRLGEISSQKGATTATGSAGGFWTALWSPDGKAVTSLGRTGSWRLWQYDAGSQFWTQRHGISGHVGAVTGLCWSPDGSYLLTTSADQTTRLHAQWKRGPKRSWHEFSRPQIHGYDLNCIASTSPWQFCSGADEKLLRVFNQPRDVAGMLNRLCGVALPEEVAAGTEEAGVASMSISMMPERAAIPVLGLSNKAMDETEVTEGNELDPTGTGSGVGTANGGDLGPPSLVTISEPPTEDILSRHTLWPEHEKLYGHGSEISEAAASSPPSSSLSPRGRGGAVLATTCKASSTDQAVIRLYDTTSWNEIKPPLIAHSLTVTRLAFFKGQDEAEYLLSVGRDRQWAVFKREMEHSRQGKQEQEAEDRKTNSQISISAKNASTKSWNRIANNPKAHSRMILDAAWIPGTEQNLGFVTAGRDKTVKIWTTKRSQSEGQDQNRETTTTTATADVQDHDQDHDRPSATHHDRHEFTLSASIARSSPVTAIAARGCTSSTSTSTSVLAAGQDDGAISLHVITMAPPRDPQLPDSDGLTVSKKSVDVSRELCPSRVVTRLAWRPRPRLRHWSSEADEGDGEDRSVELAVGSADGSVQILRIDLDELVRTSTGGA
jgi:elongator complex protein 2